MTAPLDPDAVDWTRPPYYVNGVLQLMLPGENPATIPQAVTVARILAYYRQLRPSAAEVEERVRERWSDSLATVAQVFGESGPAEDAADMDGPADTLPEPL